MKFKKDLPSTGTGDKNLVILKDKESIQGIFMGDPYDYFCLWQNKKPVEVEPGTTGARFRFKLNFVVKVGAAYEVKIFENSQTVYEDIRALAEIYNLETTVVRITRNGIDKATTYSVMPLPNPVTPETQSVLKTLTLHDFWNKSKPQEEPWPEQQTHDGFGKHDEIPF